MTHCSHSGHDCYTLLLHVGLRQQQCCSKPVTARSHGSAAACVQHAVRTCINYPVIMNMHVSMVVQMLAVH